MKIASQTSKAVEFSQRETRETCEPPGDTLAK
jgi:hypothetical protein